jgi:catechol 2,3-dioxygenase-like lactoylglutathione lyase family enzyme
MSFAAGAIPRVRQFKRGSARTHRAPELRATTVPFMRMLHLGLRVSDLDSSLAFYTALGFVELGRVPETDFGSLTMLQLPDDPFVSLELVHDPARPVEDTSAVNHLVVQTDDLDATIADLAAKGIVAEPPATPGPRTSWLTDPNGYRIELVQWPPGHPAGMTAADFA